MYRNVNNNTTDLTQKIGALCIFIDRKMFQERIDDLMMEEEQHYVLENEERHLRFFQIRMRQKKGTVLW